MRIRNFLAALLGTLFPLPHLLAGAKATASVEASPPFTASLTTGWDSLYMDRGANGLRYGPGYGDGLAWTLLSATWSPTAEDSLSLTYWQAFATGGPGYRENDTSLTYTRVIGGLNLSLGYLFEYATSSLNSFGNELIASASHDFTLGPLTLTPSVGYYLELGPDVAQGTGMADAGTSYLLFRLDGHLPIYRDNLALAPWTAFGLNFGYHQKDAPGRNSVPFYGANNFECGLALPWQINHVVSLSAYVAYSHAFTSIVGTAPNTMWSGLSVTFTY